MTTLFILGAGASKPYGFPLGTDLREWIIKNIKTVFNKNSYLIGSEISEQELDDFSLAFEKSKTNSIDLFLTRNRVFEFIGKAAIAQKIIDCENKGLSYIEDINDDWYYYYGTL